MPARRCGFARNGQAPGARALPLIPTTLATGIPLRLAQDVCVEARAFARSRSAALRRSGEFTPSEPIDVYASAIDRLAALSGRTPPGPRGDVR